MDASFLKIALHNVSQALTYPVIVLLFLGIAYTLFSLGSLLVEFIRERKYFKVTMSELLHSIKDADAEDMGSVVANSGLLIDQQTVLLTVFANRDLDEEGRWALAKKLLLQSRARTGSIATHNETVAKVAPMLGLMGTLIPLGPGIVAFGNGDVSVLADSMLVAFDTTIAGLVAAAVLFCVAKLRRTWYAEYDSSLEAAVTTMLEKIDHMTDEQRAVPRDPDGGASVPVSQLQSEAVFK